jgi:hypothetical protein
VKGYKLIDISSDHLIIERSVQFEESVLHVPQQLHADTFVLPHVRDDEHAHVNSSSDESYNSKDSDDLDTESVQSYVELVYEDAYVEPETRPKWAQTTLQNAGDLVGDPTNTRRNRSDFEDLPLALTTTEPFPPKHLFLVQSSDPQSYGKDAGNPFWESAMQEEYNSLVENQTWDLVPLNSGRKLVRCRWVYRIKSATYGQISGYKSRLVATVFQQEHGIDYDETFSPVEKMDSIHLALSIVEAKGWEVHQMEMKNAFPHGDLSEEIYMEQPNGFMQDSSLVCRMKNSLYGLKKDLRAWYANMDSYLLSHNILRCKLDPNVYMLMMVDSLLLLVLYVDDLMITGCSNLAIATVKRILHDRFLMTDMGPLHFFLALEIIQDASDIKLSQAMYARDHLEIFHMTYYKSSPTPFLSGFRIEDGGETPLVENTLYRQLVGSLLYFTHSRLDLSYAVGVVSRFMQESHEIHWKDTKCILRYVQGTITFGIHYSTDSTLDLIRFTNSD